MSNFPAELVVFATMLVAIAVFHKRALEAALCGLAILIILKITAGNFSFSAHFFGSPHHEGEWKILLNLFGLLTGFEVLSKHFSDSGIPQLLPRILPDDWKGGFVLLLLVFILSSFLDNIAAAMIGGAVAAIVFNNKVHPGFIAALVGAANAGGAGSVLGDTTTTMMWISGIAPMQVFRGYIAASVAFFFFAIPASIQQDRHERILKDEMKNVPIDKTRLVIVILMLVATAIANVFFDFPAAGLWITLAFTSFLRKIPWTEVKYSLKGSFFLLMLVMAASLIPVNELPPPSLHSTFYMGIISAAFDNIPLTKLAIEQGNYDWGLLAYAVGFGGSMLWFGSSAGVAISNLFPDARSVWKWIKGGWYIPLAYVAGFLAMYFITGWQA